MEMLPLIKGLGVTSSKGASVSHVRWRGALLEPLCLTVLVKSWMADLTIYQFICVPGLASGHEL